MVVCYSVLSCVAVCFSLFRCVAVCCSEWPQDQGDAVCCSVLQCVAVSDHKMRATSLLHRCVTHTYSVLQMCSVALIFLILFSRKWATNYWANLWTKFCGEKGNFKHTLQHTATHCNTLQHTATHCNTLQHIATHCNTPQHTATHRNTLHHTATHRNTLSIG